MKTAGRHASALVAVTALVAAAVVWWPAGDSPGPSKLATTPSLPRGDAVAMAAQRPAAGTIAPHARSHDVVAELLQRGSLRGTDVDGDWGSWAGSTLQPGRSLRRRFDYLLSGQGEVQPAQLRAWIASEVSAQHGAGGADQVLAVWDAYLRLLQSDAGARLDPSNEDAFRRTMAAQTTKRNAELGPAWAHAFFADDDREAFALLARRTAGDDAEARDPQAREMALIEAPATALTAAQSAKRDAERIAAFGIDAAARLREEDAAWAEWQQQLDDARQALRRIATNSFATTAQRDQALDAELARRFTGNQLVRARAMVGNEGR